MKKQRRKQSAKKSRSQASQQPVQPDRRAFMRFAKNAAIGLPIVSIGAFLAIRKVRGDLQEGDLTRIGGGIPAVVQIHDPTCADCTVLQRQARDALSAFDDDEVTYLVANLASEEGLAFASRYGVTRVTLLMFDPDGEMVNILRGPMDSAAVSAILTRHIAQYS